MQSAKSKLKKCVEEYSSLYPEEFSQFLQYMVMRRDEVAEEEFASVKGSSMRGLFEMPEVLHNLIVSRLDNDELEWLKSGGANKKEGGRWFQRTFPAFSYTKK